MVRKLCLAILRSDSLFGRTVILVVLTILVSACGPAVTTTTPVLLTPTAAPATTAVPPTITPEPTATPALPTSTPSLPLGGGVIAYCYQPTAGSSVQQIYAVNVDGSDNRRLIRAAIGLNHHDWSPDARTIAAVGYVDPSTWSIYVFGVDGGSLRRLTNAPGVLDSEPSWSPDGTNIAFTRTYPDQDEREEVWVMEADGSDPHWIGVEGFAAKWSPDGRRLIYTSNRSGNYEIYTSNVDGTGEQQLASTSADESFPTWSPDGSQIAYSASTGEWNTRENARTYEIYVMDADGSNVRQLTHNTAYDGNPRWSPDGSLLVFSSDRAETEHWEIYLMNADGSDVRRVTNTPANATAINPAWRPTSDAPLSPTQTSAPIEGAISADTVGQVERLRTLSGHREKVYVLEFSGDGAYLASSSADREINLWDVRTGQLVHTFSLHVAVRNDMAFSPAGYLLASADTIWNAQSGQVVQTLGRVEGPVAFSPDGSLLAVAPAGRPIVLWDVASGQVLRTFSDPVENLFRSLAFSPDGTLLAAGSNNNIIRLWDVAGGSLAHTIQHATGGQPLDHILDLAFSPDGRILASSGTDLMVRLWDVESWQVIRILSIGDAPTGLAFSPDGTILASSGPGLKLWDVESGKLLRTLAHSDVIAVAFSPDGTMLASGGYDNQVYLWAVSR